MPMNRVQFQPGLSLAELLERYGREAACEQVLAQARWPDGFVCARCGARQAHAFSSFGQAYWQCRACRAQTSLRAGTLFAASKLPLTVGWRSTDSAKARAPSPCWSCTGTWACAASAWRLKRKVMQAMRGTRPPASSVKWWRSTMPI